MRATLITAILLVLLAFCATARQEKPPGTAAAATNATATASNQATNKPDVKELLKGDSFTNSSGMVMVKISGTLWAGKFEVTQEEFQKVANSNPSQFPGDRNPVDSVSWEDAMGFCKALNEAEHKEGLLPDGFIYTLPTQAQWEGLVAGATLKDAVTSENTPRSGTSPVGSLGPNSLGLYDVRGNVQEWCLDPTDKPFRILRGGAWDTHVEVNLRLEFRWSSASLEDRQNSYGFRCVLVPGKFAATAPPTEQP